MSATMADLFGDLSLEEVRRRRRKLEADIAFLDAHMHGPIGTWPSDISEERGDMAQTWYWLGLYEEELEEEAGARD